MRVIVFLVSGYVNTLSVEIVKSYAGDTCDVTDSVFKLTEVHSNQKRRMSSERRSVRLFFLNNE